MRFFPFSVATIIKILCSDYFHPNSHHFFYLRSFDLPTLVCSPLLSANLPSSLPIQPSNPPARAPVLLLCVSNFSLRKPLKNFTRQIFENKTATALTKVKIAIALLPTIETEGEECWNSIWKWRKWNAKWNYCITALLALLLNLRKASEELEEIDKQINEKKEMSRKLVGTQDDAICQICRKTKFADGIGKNLSICSYNYSFKMLWIIVIFWSSSRRL